MLETSRSVFFAWKNHVQFVASERKRLRELRIAEARAEAKGRKIDRALLRDCVAAWTARVRDRIKKRIASDAADEWREDRSMRAALENMAGSAKKGKRAGRAAGHWQAVEARRTRRLLAEWSRLTGEGREKIAWIHLRAVTRKWRSNAAERRGVRGAIAEFKRRKETELVERVLGRWRFHAGRVKEILERACAVKKRGHVLPAFRRWVAVPNLVAGEAMVTTMEKLDAVMSVKVGWTALVKATRWRKSLLIVERVRDSSSLREAWEAWTGNADEAVMWENRMRAWLGRARRRVERRAKEDEEYAKGRARRSGFRRWLRATQKRKKEKQDQAARDDRSELHLAAKREAQASECLEKWMKETARRVEMKWRTEAGRNHWKERRASEGFSWWLEHARGRRKAKAGRRRAQLWAEERIVRNAWRAWRGEWRAGKASEGGRGEEGGGRSAVPEEGGSEFGRDGGGGGGGGGGWESVLKAQERGDGKEPENKEEAEAEEGFITPLRGSPTK